MLNKEWTKEKIQKLLTTNNIMVERSLLILYSRQTRDERLTEHTTCKNDMGFNGCDAKLLTSFAKQIKENKYNKPEGQRLSFKQMIWARRKIQKYSKQLADYANARNEILAQRALGTADKLDGETFRKGGDFGNDLSR